MGQYYNVVIDEKDVYDRSVDGEYTMAKLMEHSWWKNPFVCCISDMLFESKHKVAWVGDYSDEINPELYALAWSKKKCKTIHMPERLITLENKFLVNHDKKVYFNLNKYKEKSVDNKGLIIHPLPLLTVIGNGLGGGDYRSEIGKEFIGAWANDTLEMSVVIPEGYKEIFPVFKEV